MKNTMIFFTNSHPDRHAKTATDAAHADISGRRRDDGLTRDVSVEL